MIYPCVLQISLFQAEMGVEFTVNVFCWTLHYEQIKDIAEWIDEHNKDYSVMEVQF